ncbi:MAG: hypothetical protein WA021_02415 [Minisyncoccia bacterium]
MMPGEYEKNTNIAKAVAVLCAVVVTFGGVLWVDGWERSSTLFREIGLVAVAVGSVHLIIALVAVWLYQSMAKL